MATQSKRKTELMFTRPLTTVDVVILTIQASQLHVLLVKRPDEPSDPFPAQWALPGGFVDVDRDGSLEECALRKLREKTGVRAPYLEQVGSWGNATRDPRGWSVTQVYVALLATDDIRPTQEAGTIESRWEPIRGDGVAPSLAFDHGMLLKAALTRVRGKAEYTSLPIHLLPREFTLSELQRVFEILLGRPLEKKAFRTRMLASDLLVSLDELKETSRRPAQLYRGKERGGLTYFARAFEPQREK